MKRGILLFILMILMVLPVVSASLQHGILGYVQSAEDGTSSNGAVVTFNVFRGTENYCNLNDIIGKNGNSKKSNWYAQDIGNCETNWQPGDIVQINIAKGSRNASTSVTLTENGSDQAPDIRLSSSGINYFVIIIVVLVIILLIILIICFLKRKQKFKNEKGLKEK